MGRDPGSCVASRVLSILEGLSNGMVNWFGYSLAHYIYLATLVATYLE
jgi:hypothetical protein